MKFKRKKKINKIYFLILIIIIQSTIMIEYIDYKADDVVVRSIQLLVKKDIYEVVNKNINKVFVNEDLDDLIVISKNDNDEIVSIDYKLNKCYKSLNNYLDLVYEEVTNTDYSDNYYTDGVYFVSSGVINDMMMFNSLGIKVPTRVNVINDVRINFKTNVVNYGINSVLVELYLVMDIESWFVNPFNDGKFGETFEYVISSRIVNGRIPDYYGGIIEKSSSIVSS